MSFKYMSIEITSYKRFKESLDIALTGAADHMVHVGFLLMQARDTDILRESGYSGMGEFAQKEYNLSPDQTSRFISIAERFGDGQGRLKDEWQQYGYTKLSEMLTLPDAVAAAIPPEITREEIRELKAEVKAEQEITPIEVAIEEAERKAQEPEAADKPIMLQFFTEYFRPAEHAEEFVRAMLIDWDTPRLAKDETYDRRCVLDSLAPSGIGILEARIPGKGRFMLSFKGEDAPPVLVNIRENKTEPVSWLEVRDGFSDLADEVPGEWEHIDLDEESAKSRWSVLYQTDFPKRSNGSGSGIGAGAEREERKSETDSQKGSKAESGKKVKIAPAQKEKPEKAPAGDDQGERKPQAEAENRPEQLDEPEANQEQQGEPEASQGQQIGQEARTGQQDEAILMARATDLRTLANRIEMAAGDSAAHREELMAIEADITRYEEEICAAIESIVNGQRQ